MKRLEPRWLLLGLLIAGALSCLHPDLTLRHVSNAGGMSEFGAFFGAAVRPTVTSELESSISLWPSIGRALHSTITIALAAMSLSIGVGLVLGVLASRAIWTSRDEAVFAHPIASFCQQVLGPTLRGFVRAVLALFRSVHELVWALLFCGLFGVHGLSGILALAVPYAATLGRLYAEILDESPREAARAVRVAGAGPSQVFLLGIVPRAAPQMLSYTFYRLDCAIRSSAVLGFVGLPTLGREVRKSFDYDHYSEVWTWLYVLFGLLIAFEALGGVVRRRLGA